jgi:hypothetical protein
MKKIGQFTAVVLFLYAMFWERKFVFGAEWWGTPAIILTILSEVGTLMWMLFDYLEIE